MTDFLDINEVIKNDTEETRAFIKEAELTKTTRKGVGGRPRKKNKAERYFNVYVTNDEKKRIFEYAEEINMSVSTLVKSLLTKEGII